MLELRQWADNKYGKEKVDQKIKSIIKGTEKENIQIMRLRLSQNKSIERLEKLVANDQNIEYITSGSPLIEYALERLIASYQFVTNSSLILGDFDTEIELKPKKINDGNNAMGNIINELERFVPKEDKLIGLLGNFNGNKKKSTHKLYEENIDPAEVNASVRTYVQGNPVREILRVINENHTKLVDELLRKFKEYGFNSIGPANEADLIKLVPKKK